MNSNSIEGELILKEEYSEYKPIGKNFNPQNNEPEFVEIQNNAEEKIKEIKRNTTKVYEDQKITTNYRIYMYTKDNYIFSFITKGQITNYKKLLEDFAEKFLSSGEKSIDYKIDNNPKNDIKENTNTKKKDTKKENSQKKNNECDIKFLLAFIFFALVVLLKIIYDFSK